MINMFINKNSTDCNAINISLVKNIIQSIAKPLTHIFNQSLLQKRTKLLSAARGPHHTPTWPFSAPRFNPPYTISPSQIPATAGAALDPQGASQALGQECWRCSSPNTSVGSARSWRSVRGSRLLALLHPQSV